MSGLCPTPNKQRFATEAAALDVARKAGFALQKRLKPYTNCPCGWIHLTSSEMQHGAPILGDGPLDDAAFALATRADVMGRAAPEDADCLRRDENLVRWASALKTFQIDLQMQLTERAGVRDPEVVDWRRRLGTVQRALRERRAEAKKLLIEFYARPGRKPFDVQAKEVRVEASKRANDRLIEAHTLEFIRYVEEEFRAQGLELPRTIRGHCLDGTCGKDQCVSCLDKSEERNG